MFQVITVDPNDLITSPSESLELTVSYTTIDPVDPTLTGLGLRLHFDSNALEFNDITEILEFGFIGSSVMPDTEDFDSDVNTDSFILLSWVDIFGNWPNSVPIDLYTIDFTTSDIFEETTINFTAASTAVGFELQADSLVIRSETPPGGLPEISSAFSLLVFGILSIGLLSNLIPKKSN